MNSIAAHRSLPVLVAVVLVIFCVRNLPWHLDDFDQAKLAYVSFDMVDQGNWLSQHLPRGGSALKPPLVGWISAGLHLAGIPWELAWRLPLFLAAIALVALLAAGAGRILPDWGPPVAIAAFCLNSLTPRLATLVATDMLLTLCIFLPGWLVWRKLECRQEWTPRERWILFGAVTAGLMTKGLVVYAFLLPGLVFFLVRFRRDPAARLAWCGWWPWFAPLVFFALWTGICLATTEGFYEGVVKREFLGRFTVGRSAVHTNQPVYYYVVNLLHKLAPWSLLLAGIAFLKPVRAVVRTHPALAWLACWAVGGLVLMSLVPSKRVDRIFPVVPPLCLLLVGFLAAMREGGQLRAGTRRLLAASFAVAFAAWGGYAGYLVVRAWRGDAGALPRFGREARSLVETHDLTFSVVRCKREGMLLYLRKPAFTGTREALDSWHDRTIDALVIEDTDLDKLAPQLGPFTILLTSGDSLVHHSVFHLIRRN